MPTHKIQLRSIRTVSAPTQSGSDESTTSENTEPEVDWKAKYEETLAHSREWERRAKANKSAADELQQLKESQMSEQQKAAARAERLQKELDSLKSEKQRNEWRAQVMKDTGLPESVIAGETLEAMQAHAKAVQAYVESLNSSKAQAYRVDDPTRTPNKPDTEMADFLGSLFPKQ